ncbi:TPA: hypothetical protein ACUT5J_001522 [Pseudomonas aeruginosa]|uniref:hypothetical protein n=1 Tax=Pseudomonas TaxID=286 RepID=UPI001F33ED79|nr:hypothetical protein [Pseudomonas aeruginosa]MCT5013238.1 hypothetical protein [Pseudomonas aeruginosa]MCT5044571.1 hypothetical protein [Pseudomonas aeruginosa]MCT5094048.1 hypothetical protein [Pseudomonas aeruginosa]MDG4471645.1 hypothetical protein [Pseudomonas aeruginosa]MDP5547210.1 hypothetical protein [Pseudomonas aeruginosa]
MFIAPAESLEYRRPYAGKLLRSQGTPHLVQRADGPRHPGGAEDGHPPCHEAATSARRPFLDVRRRRQITAEGWTPEHDDQHSHGQMARAAACYALAGSSAPNDGTAALLVSLAWPWDEQWWKPSTARRDLIKAGALILAEIERIDRVAASQGGPSDA